MLRAEGYASALKAIHEQARDVDGNTMALQYMKTLENVGSSPSTKFVLPMELTGMVQNLANSLTAGGGMSRSNGSGGNGSDIVQSDEAQEITEA